MGRRNRSQTQAVAWQGLHSRRVRVEQPVSSLPGPVSVASVLVSVPASPHMAPQGTCPLLSSGPRRLLSERGYLETGK